MKCYGKTATILGTDRNDKLRGTWGADVIIARDGNDIIRGRGGRDRICAGRGNDRIRGGGGGDCISGFLGSDNVFGGVGNDLITGGKGNTFDWLKGEDSNDKLTDLGQATTGFLVATAMTFWTAAEALTTVWWAMPGNDILQVEGEETTSSMVGMEMTLSEGTMGTRTGLSPDPARTSWTAVPVNETPPPMSTPTAQST